MHPQENAIRHAARTAGIVRNRKVFILVLAYLDGMVGVIFTSPRSIFAASPVRNRYQSVGLYCCLRLTSDEAAAALVGIGSLIPYYLILYLFRAKLKKRFSFVLENKSK